MHKEYEVIGDKVIIDNGLGHTEERKTVDNIEEILIAENNIEEMENLINIENEEIEKSKKYIKTKVKSPLLISSIWAFSFILQCTIKKWVPAICHFMCSLIWFCNGLFITIIPERKSIKESKKVISILEEEKKIEEEKLKEANLLRI